MQKLQRTHQGSRTVLLYGIWLSIALKQIKNNLNLVITIFFSLTRPHKDKGKDEENSN